MMLFSTNVLKSKMCAVTKEQQFIYILKNRLKITDLDKSD